MSRWTETHGRKPRTGDAPLDILWANGRESTQPYTANKLIFKQRGWDFDVKAVRRSIA